MEDFASRLMAFLQWHEKEFTNEQLKHHLIECLTLLESGNEHLYAELVDLIQISKISLRQNLGGEELDALYKKRFDKFISKLSLDEK